MSVLGFNLRSLTVAVLINCLLCTACTTTRQVALSPAPSSSQLAREPGRKAVIELRNGERLSGTIVGVDDNGLTLRTPSGSIRGVAFEDMQSMQTSRFSWGRTAAAVGGAILIAGAAFIAALHRQNLRDE
jgi:hypothetical protein